MPVLRPNEKQTWRTRVIRGFVLVTFGLVIGEVLLHLFNLPLDRFMGALPHGVEGAVESDPELGWKHRPGSFSVVVAEEAGKLSPRFPVTYWTDRSRATRTSFEHPAALEVLLLGCSYVEGYLLGDEDTFGWKLQTLAPDVMVSNGGVAGYGTLQSYLELKRPLRQDSRKHRSLVVYGFADFHAFRNIKNPLRQFYTSTPGLFPYCDEAQCQLWEGRPKGVLRTASRVFALIQDAIDSAYLLQRKDLARKVTMRLLREMSTLVSESGGELVIAPVSLDDTSWLAEFEQAGIPVVMCDSETLHRREYRLVDGHPNARWGEDFSRCLAKGLRPFITELEALGPPLS